MKKLYCSPYRIFTDWLNDNPIKKSWDLAYCRYVIGGEVAGIIWRDGDYIWRAVDENFKILEEAMNYTDSHLIKNGVIFLTDEQFDKLSVLS